MFFLETQFRKYECFYFVGVFDTRFIQNIQAIKKTILGIFGPSWRKAFFRYKYWCVYEFYSAVPPSAARWVSSQLNAQLCMSNSTEQ